MFILCLFCASILILLSSKRIFSIFLGWDGLGVTSFILVNFFKNWNTFNNSLLTFLRNRVGDVFFLVIFRFFIFKINLEFSLFLRVLIVFLRITKRAQFPFIRWLPAAMAAPTPVSALVHSSTLVTAGVFILFYFSFFLEKNTIILLFFIGLLTVLLRGLRATLETDFKKIVAFRTLSQVGFLFLMLSNIKFFLCLFHLFSHAFFKSILFISVGRVLHSSSGRQEARRFLKNKLNSKSSNLLILLRIINLIGLFFLRGFWRKDLFLIFSNTILFFAIIKIILYIIVALTLFYSIKILYFLKNFSQKLLKENSISLRTSTLILSILSCAFSLYFYENYLYFYENYLYFYENYLYLLFILIFLLGFLFFINKKLNREFYKIINLLVANFQITLLLRNYFKFLEKKLLDRNYFKFINLIIYNNNYLFLIIMIFLLII